MIRTLTVETLINEAIQDFKDFSKFHIELNWDKIESLAMASIILEAYNKEGFNYKHEIFQSNDKMFNLHIVVL